MFPFISFCFVYFVTGSNGPCIGPPLLLQLAVETPLLFADVCVFCNKTLFVLELE